VNPIAAKIFSSQVSANVQNFFRLSTAAIVLTIIAALQGKREGNNDSSVKLTPFVFVLPALAMYGFAELFISGIGLSKANISSFVNAGLGPIISIVVLATFIAEERKFLKNFYVWIAIITGLIGSALVMLNFQNGSNLSIDMGIVLVIISSFSWAGYTTIAKKYFSNFPPIIFLRNVIITTSLLFLLTIIFTKEIFLVTKVNMYILAGMIATGVLSDALTNITFFLGIKKIPAVKANILILIVPIITIITSWIVLHEPITLQQLTGCIIVFSANILLVYKDFKKDKFNKAKPQI
jgi:drug/metabolite transporter (DMT)-like permease